MKAVAPLIVVTSTTNAIAPVFDKLLRVETSSKITPVVTTNTLNPSAPEYMRSTTDTTLYLEASRTLQLLTAVAKVYNPTDLTWEQSIEIVMDSGSQ